MTEETLRRWANDELSRDEARDVYRWMVRCTSPELPALLTGLLRERREREADAALRQRGSTWRELVARWAELLASGAAQWTEPGMMPVPASADAVEEERRVWLDERSGETVLFMELDAGVEVTVFLTDDDGGSVRLGAGTGAPLEWTLPTMGARPTVWVVMGALPPFLPADATEQLARLAGDESLDVMALRWTDGA